ncbi:MAG: hypothetical protein WCE68_10570 [Anaerolineales bacterium]
MSLTHGQERIDNPSALHPDGFESGSLTPNSQNLSVSTAAAYWGVHGLAVTVSGQDTYVEDDSPLSEGEYHARFYVNPNGVTIGSGQAIILIT